jgi:hypothetical protein
MERLITTLYAFALVVTIIAVIFISYLGWTLYKAGTNANTCPTQSQPSKLI